MIQIRTGKLLFVQPGMWSGDATEVGLQAGALPPRFVTDNPDEFGPGPYLCSYSDHTEARYEYNGTLIILWNV